MSNAYPIETVIRAHALFMDYVSFRDIERILRGVDGKGPTYLTVHKWAKAGEGTSGIAWDRWREICQAKRAVASAERTRDRLTPSDYEKMVGKSLVDLEYAQEVLMKGIEDGEIKLRLSDLKDLIKTQQLLHGRATQRIEMETTVTRMVAMIVGERARQVISDGNEAEQFLDLVAQDFEKLYASPKESLVSEADDVEYEMIEGPEGSDE